MQYCSLLQVLMPEFMGPWWRSIVRVQYCGLLVEYCTGGPCVCHPAYLFSSSEKTSRSVGYLVYPRVPSGMCVFPFAAT